MCKPASMVETKDKMYWSEETDSHSEIITEFSLHESGLRGVNVVPIEIAPPNGNLSLPLSKWIYSVDYAGISRELPAWYDAKVSESRARACLKEWAAVKLKGWRVKEAFTPINPLKVKCKTLPKAELKRLLKDWSSSVMSSVGSAVWSSPVWSSVMSSVGSAVWSAVRSSDWWSVWSSSVGSSVRSSVWWSVEDSIDSYIGSLFPNIKEWKYTKCKNPWKSLRKLWINGYVPSYDGTTWRLHRGPKAKVVMEITKEELNA